MTPDGVDPRLGIQLWCERTDDTARVDELVDRAAELGFGQLRIFLMWPWIQADSKEQWDWRLWDDVFAAAERNGMTIKATLTANSGPWWLGTPSVLHSHTLTLDESWIEPQRAYVREAVQRYAGHAALGQWILWNEPNYPHAAHDADASRPVGARQAWTALLRERYADIGALNTRWRSGYATVDDVPFLEDLVHPAHRDAHWHSWMPVLDDATLRARLLENELRSLAQAVRAIDPVTPLCINPNQTFNNHAQYATRLDEMATIVDTLGASFHAPWSFAEFAEIDDHASLVVAGLRLLQSTPGSHRVEVTEAQTGNTFYAGVNPLGVGAPEIAATYLAPLLAGADSVTGWCFNTRKPDFESGEWGLLNDDDSISDRARSVPRVRDALAALDEHIGTWAPEPPQATVAISERSQAMQFALALNTDTPWSTRAAAAVQGSALTVVELGRLGVTATLAQLDSPALQASRLIVALHMASWDRSDVEVLLAAAEGGATVLIDGTSGQFDADLSLHRPWPGHWATETGLRSRGLETSIIGKQPYQVRLHGRPLGTVTGTRSAIDTNDTWSAVLDLTYAHDSEPLLWERPWGAGRLLYSTASLATTLLEPGSPREVVSSILALAAQRATMPAGATPLSPATTVLRVRGELGEGWGVFAPPTIRRSGEPVVLALEPGRYLDLWSGAVFTVSANGLCRLDAAEGIALLVHDRPPHQVAPS